MENVYFLNVFVDVQTIIYINRSRINDHFPERVHLPRNV